MINYKIDSVSGRKIVRVDTVTGPAIVDAGVPENAKVSFTATTDMQRSVGKVMAVNNGLATVDTVWNGRRVLADNVVAAQPFSIGDAVVVMEHLKLNGEMEIICCVAAPDTGDINFLNLSWELNKVRIDLVTGETDHGNS